MSTLGWMGVALACLAALGVVTVLFRRHSRHREQARLEVLATEAVELEKGARAAEVANLERSLSLPAGHVPLLDQEWTSALEPGDEVIIANPLDENEVLVFGRGADLVDLGDVVGSIPAQLAGAVVGAQGMLRGGMELGEQTGVLVRLTNESSRAFREGSRVVDRSGDFVAVVRNGQGQFRHMLRFKEVGRLQGFATGVGVLSAIATQAQLAAIERKLEEVLDGVGDIKETLDRQEHSELIGTQRMLRDIFRAAYSAGVLTQSAWDQIAPHHRTIESQAENAHAKLQGLIADLINTSKVSARRDWIRANGAQLKEAQRRAQIADSAVYQYEALRCWWLGLSNDPTAEHYARQLQSRKVELADRRTRELDAMREALERAGETRWWNYVHAPFATMEIRKITLRTREDVERVAGIERAAELAIEAGDAESIHESEES